MDIYLDASRLSIHPPLFTSPSGDGCILLVSSVIIPVKDRTLILSLLTPSFTLTVYDHQEKNPSDHCDTLSYGLVLLLFHHNALQPTVLRSFSQTTTPTILYIF